MAPLCLPPRTLAEDVMAAILDPKAAGKATRPEAKQRAILDALGIASLAEGCNQAVVNRLPYIGG